MKKYEKFQETKLFHTNFEVVHSEHNWPSTCNSLLLLICILMSPDNLKSESILGHTKMFLDRRLDAPEVGNLPIQINNTFPMENTLKLVTPRNKFHQFFKVHQVSSPYFPIQCITSGLSKSTIGCIPKLLVH
jgi:hypothetical protein